MWDMYPWKNQVSLNIMEELLLDGEECLGMRGNEREDVYFYGIDQGCAYAVAGYWRVAKRDGRLMDEINALGMQVWWFQLSKPIFKKGHRFCWALGILRYSPGFDTISCEAH